MPAAACLVLLGAGIITIPRAILKDEQARSLGNGQLASLIGSPNAAVAARAALAIGRTRRPEGASLLAAHIDDPRPAVRAMSIYGLGVIGLGTAWRSISQHAGDPSSAVRLAVVDALARYAAAGRLGTAHERATQAIVRDRLLHDPDPVVRGRAAIALYAFAGPLASKNNAKVLARAAAADASSSVRERAMWAIYRAYASETNQAVVLAALNAPDTVLRIEAVRALGTMFAGKHDAAAIATLKRMETDPSWRVQEQAAQSIRVIRGLALTADWKTIPRYVHIPKPVADPLANLPALAWPKPSPKPGSPDAMLAPLGPALLPTTAREMTSPAPGPHPRVRIVTTKGSFYVVFYPEWAPLTVANFLHLAARGFYDNNRWFRIVPDFVVQTGEKDAIKQPGPGYSIGAEQNPIEQDSYVISMGLNYDEKTNTPELDSAGSEYYITLSPQYHLDDAFTVFGRVTSGYDVLGRLVESDRVVRIERVADERLQ